MDQIQEVTYRLPLIEKLNLGGHLLPCSCHDLVHAIEQCPLLVDLELRCGIDIREVAYIPAKETTVLSRLERLDVFDLLRNSVSPSFFTPAASYVGHILRGPIPQTRSYPGWGHQSSEKRANSEQHRLFMEGVRQAQRLIEARLPNLRDVGIDKGSRPNLPDPRFFCDRLQYTFLVIDAQIRERMGWDCYEQRDLRKTLAPDFWNDEENE